MSSKRLLIVDDEPDFGQFVCMVAEEMDFEVKVTTRATVFKEAYQTFEPTVIILDVVMPETDGIALVTWLARRHYRGKLVIVTGFTPHYADMAATISVAKGMASVTALYKPVDLEKHRAALKKLRKQSDFLLRASERESHRCRARGPRLESMKNALAGQD